MWLLAPPELDQNVRVDTGVIAGDEVGVFYDPMIAKLIVWGEDRQVALQRLQALANYRIAGVVTNIDFFAPINQPPGFQSCAAADDFIDQHRLALFAVEHSEPINRALALLSVYLCLAPGKSRSGPAATDPTSPWRQTDAWRPKRTQPMETLADH